MTIATYLTFLITFETRRCTYSNVSCIIFFANIKKGRINDLAEFQQQITVVK